MIYKQNKSTSLILVLKRRSVGDILTSLVIFSNQHSRSKFYLQF